MKAITSRQITKKIIAPDEVVVLVTRSRYQARPAHLLFEFVRRPSATIGPASHSERGAETARD